MLLTLLAATAPCVWLIGAFVVSRFLLRLSRHLVGQAPAVWESVRLRYFSRGVVVSDDVSNS